MGTYTRVCLPNIHCYRRLIYRQVSKINNAVRLYSHIPDNKQNDSSLKRPKSLNFYDYQLLYKFPYIMFPRLINIVKRNQTILTVLSTPIIIGLQLQGLMSVNDCIKLLLIFYVATGCLHGACYMCNNFIGSIRFNRDHEELIISYSNYWGNRIDLKTNVKDIIPLTETGDNKFYRKLNIKSCKQELKISTEYGEIIDLKTFGNIFGYTV